MQLLVTLQNVNEVNREALSPWAASSVYDSTQHNGLVTICQPSVACSNGFKFKWFDKKCYCSLAIPMLLRFKFREFDPKFRQQLSGWVLFVLFEKIVNAKIRFPRN